jgi:hypothetical protein
MGPLGVLLSRFNLDDYKSTMEGLRDPGQFISELWEMKPPERHVHIIVETPAEGGTPTGRGRWNNF